VNHMKEMIKKLTARFARWLDELLFPQNVLCLCCDRALGEDAKDGICPACEKALERLNAQQEQRERTKSRQLPDGLVYMHAAYPYEGPARQLVHRLKYDCIREAHVPLARAMACLPSGEEEIIVPVPTDPARRRKRGFNQAELLARHVGKELGMQVVCALSRKEKRRPQTGLTAAQRRQNLLDCMEAEESVGGKRVLLIDDVYTTGSTAMEAARALHKAGAKSVAMFAATCTTDELFYENDPFALPLRRLNRAKILKIPDKNSGEL